MKSIPGSIQLFWASSVPPTFGLERRESTSWLNNHLLASQNGLLTLCLNFTCKRQMHCKLQMFCTYFVYLLIICLLSISEKMKPGSDEESSAVLDFSAEQVMFLTFPVYHYLPCIRLPLSSEDRHSHVCVFRQQISFVL